MSDRAAILARLATLAARDAEREHLATRLCTACRVILGADGASLTVENGTANRTTLSSTDAVAMRLEDLQDVLGEGPCWDAFQHGIPVGARLGAEPDRWPEFARAALEAVGPLYLRSFPMRPGGVTLGVLSVYFNDDRELPEPDDSAQFLADAVGAALLNDPGTEDMAAGVVDGEAGPWSSRAEVHQATGMVIAQLGIPAPDALAIMRAHAYATDRSLGEIAHLVVTRQLDFHGET